MVAGIRKRREKRIQKVFWVKKKGKTINMATVRTLIGKANREESSQEGREKKSPELPPTTITKIKKAQQQARPQTQGQLTRPTGDQSKKRPGNVIKGKGKGGKGLWTWGRFKPGGGRSSKEDSKKRRNHQPGRRRPLQDPEDTSQRGELPSGAPY